MSLNFAGFSPMPAWGWGLIGWTFPIVRSRRTKSLFSGLMHWQASGIILRIESRCLPSTSTTGPPSTSPASKDLPDSRASTASIILSADFRIIINDEPWVDNLASAHEDHE